MLKKKWFSIHLVGLAAGRMEGEKSTRKVSDAIESVCLNFLLSLPVRDGAQHRGDQSTTGNDTSRSEQIHFPYRIQRQFYYWLPPASLKNNRQSTRLSAEPEFNFNHHTQAPSMQWTSLWQSKFGHRAYLSAKTTSNFGASVSPSNRCQAERTSIAILFEESSSVASELPSLHSNMIEQALSSKYLKAQGVC